MIVIGSNTSDNGQSRFTEDVSHFMELRQNRQLALLKRSAKNLYKNVNLNHIFSLDFIWWFIHEIYINILVQFFNTELILL